MEHDYVENFAKTLPSLIYGISNEIESPGFYINRVNHKVCDDSWISVISEARFEDEEGTVFLSEKVFKPIATHHPFIVMGNKHSLKEMKKLGYKTFSKWIDESYDNNPLDFERFEMALHQLELLAQQHPAQVQQELRPVLEHNHQRLFSIVAETQAQMIRMVRAHTPAWCWS